MAKQKYGVVYTPDLLSSFVALLLTRMAHGLKIKNVLDPASGECSLLKASQNILGEECNYIGIDIDKSAVEATKNSFNVLFNDFILPFNVRKKTSEYWKEKLPPIDAIIANPPWSSEKIYEMATLKKAGYDLAAGQYDSYVLFIEQSYNVLCDNGVMAFILPDSIFDTQNENLRKFLVEKMQIKVIARLGEKIFEDVNRATTVIICKKNSPLPEDETICFRLSTEDRKDILDGKGDLIDYFEKNSHTVKQIRFLQNSGINFNIDARCGEEKLLQKITSGIVHWESVFHFGRGVEISKSGKVVYCPFCKLAQGYKKSKKTTEKKCCIHCGQYFSIANACIDDVISTLRDTNLFPLYVGENIRRYGIAGNCYIEPNIMGINYKSSTLYMPQKLLIRKTGLGIYGVIDYTHTMTSQTVYILKYIDEHNPVPMEYYLALLNSRVVYYYYLKCYGENEWKSHPYFTKQIIFSLPLKPYEGNDLDLQIIYLATKLLHSYNHQIDLQLEDLIMQKYGLTDEEKAIVANEMNSLPNLSAVSDMKMGCQ